MDDQRIDRASGGMKQFSIRDLLFLIVIVAVALGWWMDKRPVPARFIIGGGADHAYMLDTATGQAWEKSYTLSTVNGEPRQYSTTETTGFVAPKISKSN
jgi:hypothetical protein